MTQCGKILESMRDASPVEAQRIRERLGDALKECPHLPLAFRQQSLIVARAYECSASMREADAILQKALHCAREDDKTRRNDCLVEARLLISKAVALGANQNFQHAVRRKIENIMLTGGVEHHGPTAAKPRFGAPASPPYGRR